MVTGRPEFPYTPEIVDRICYQIATTDKGLHAICKQEGMPSYQTVWRWINDPTKDFRDRYAQAKEEQMDFMAEQIMEIADDDSDDVIVTEKGSIPNKEFIMRSRLRVDTRKWLMSKLARKKYGESSQVDLNVNKDVPLFPDPKEDSK